MTEDPRSVGPDAQQRALEPSVRANDAGLADRAKGWKSAYVHIPFCAYRCPYCDFAIVDESKGDTGDRDKYIDAVIAEISMESEFGPLDAVNFGGGTPSRVQPEQLGRVIGALENRFGLAPGCEVSLEVNPEDWSDAVADGLVDAGFTRVSIGAQSFDEAMLGVLGRQHRSSLPADVAASAKAAGFASVSVDLIYGHPSESDASWRGSVATALDLPVDHISTYALTVEHGTELSRSIIAGAPGPDDDIQADRFKFFCQESAAAGFDRYEVSNHAKPGHACRYNLSTWAHGEYLGFGMGAHDHRWGIRSRNHRRLDRYYADISRGVRPRLGSETLTRGEQNRDEFMLGLRLAAGVRMSPFAERFLQSSEGARFIAAGVIRVEAGRLVTTDPMLTDGVAREALSVSADDC
ncbi:MAG: radical SAM family heme chaperone HemW [Actinomycetota bacterium]